MGRLVDITTEPDAQGMPGIVEWHEPVSVDELREFYADSLYNFEGDTEKERQEQEIRNLCLERQQQHWYEGVPRDDIIVCAACDAPRPAHGAATYDGTTLCTRCVEEYELRHAWEHVTDAPGWAVQRAFHAGIERAVCAAEQHGALVAPLPDGRWADILTMYLRQAVSHYPAEEFERHWPEGLVPTMFQVYIRGRHWRPGQSFDTPEGELVVTSRSKLKTLLAEGLERLLDGQDE